MAWPAIIAAGAQILGGIMGGKGKEAKDKADKAYQSAETRALESDKAKYNAIDTLFQNKVADYQSQLQRQRKQRGLDQFRSFNTMQQIAPGYSESGGIVVPQEPTIGDFNNMISTAGMSSPTVTNTGGGGSSSIMKTIDPVAVKLGLFK